MQDRQLKERELLAVGIAVILMVLAGFAYIMIAGLLSSS
jgi:hypothetical protein